MQTNSNTHRNRTVIAAVIFIIVVLSTAACGLVGKPLAQQYACSYTSYPSDGQTLTAVTVATYNRQTDGTDDWKALIRERNHYIGSDSAPLDPAVALLIPLKCGPGEKPGSVSGDVPASLGG